MLFVLCKLPEESEFSIFLFLLLKLGDHFSATVSMNFMRHFRGHNIEN